MATHDPLAIWLVLARRGSFGIPRNNPRYLCHARSVLTYCLSQSNSAPKSHLVHGLVEYCAWGDHGDSVHSQSSTRWPSVGRCCGFDSRSGGTGGSDSAAGREKHSPCGITAPFSRPPQVGFAHLRFPRRFAPRRRLEANVGPRLPMSSVKGEIC